jgi:hypothetical protein
VRPRYGRKYIFKKIIEYKECVNEMEFCVSQKEIKIGPSEHDNATFNFTKVLGI